MKKPNLFHGQVVTLNETGEQLTVTSVRESHYTDGWCIHVMDQDGASFVVDEPDISIESKS